MLGQRGLGHPPHFSPLTSDRGSWPLGCCSVETAAFSTSSPNRNQLRPRPRGKALAGLSLGRGPVMTAHTHSSLPLHGAVPLEARKVWARLAKGRGCAGFCLWPVGPLSRNGPLPRKDHPGCFQRPVCEQSLPLFLQAAHSAPKSGRKEHWVGPLSGPLALSLGTRQGVHTSRKRQKDKLTSVPAPCTFRELA